MASTFQLEIATPERLLVREQAVEAQIPAANGYLGVLAEHSPLLAAMGSGELTFVSEGRKRSLAVDGGWVQVLPNRVRVLVDRAEHADQIDAARAQNALKRAQERVLNPLPGIDVARALNAMKRAQARLAAASRS